MLIQAITIFPEMFDSMSNMGLQAEQENKIFGSFKPSIPENLPITNLAMSMIAPSEAVRE